MMPLALRKISDFFFPKAAWFGLVMVFGLSWSHAFFYIGLVGMLACLLASPTQYKELVKVCQENIALLALLLFAYIAAGLVYTQAPMELAIHDVKKYRKLLLIPVFLLLYQEVIWARRLVIAYGCGVVILMVPTLLDGSGLAHAFSIDLSRFRNASYTEQSLVYWRNHIVHGFHAAILFAICVLSAIRRPKLTWLFSIVATICVLNVVFFLHGRTALISLLAATLLMAVSYIANTRLRVGLVIAIVGISLSAYQFSDKIHARVNSIAQEAQAYSANPSANTSGGVRLFYWSMSWGMFLEAPIVGKGPGAFRANLERDDNPLRTDQHWHAHSEYFTLLSQHGLVGLLLFLLLSYQIYRQPREQGRWQKGVVRMGLAIFLVNAITDSSLNNESEGWTFVLLACLANIRSSTSHDPSV